MERLLYEVSDPANQMNQSSSDGRVAVVGHCGSNVIDTRALMQCVLEV